MKFLEVVKLGFEVEEETQMIQYVMMMEWEFDFEDERKKMRVTLVRELRFEVEDELKKKDKGENRGKKREKKS